MKLRIWTAMLSFAAFFTAAICRFPDFAAAWAKLISRPVLAILNRISTPFPIVLMEWGVLLLVCTWIVFMIMDFFRKGLRRALLSSLRRCGICILAFVLCFVLLWLPLYPVDIPEYPADKDQLAASCALLIDELNAAALDFTVLPEDMPAKIITFPGWMRIFNISGLFFFPTGEALISPELAPAAMPFVAVHEYMHALGYAGEGEANIAAWEECIARGDLYADSARIWALKYSMAALHNMDPESAVQLHNSMNEATYAAYRQIGGGYVAKHDGGAQTVFNMLGVSESTGDYEILSAYLASRMPE